MPDITPEMILMMRNEVTSRARRRRTAIWVSVLISALVVSLVVFA